MTCAEVKCANKCTCRRCQAHAFFSRPLSTYAESDFSPSQLIQIALETLPEILEDGYSQRRLALVLLRIVQTPEQGGIVRDLERFLGHTAKP